MKNYFKQLAKDCPPEDIQALHDQLKPMTNAERVRAFNQRRRASGLVQIKVWVHPDESAQVRKYASKQPLTKRVLSG